MTTQINSDQAVEIISALFKAKLVPMLYGHPGIGKSSIYRQVADTFNLKLIDLRLSQCEPTDLMGLPKHDGDRAMYSAFNTFPMEGDSIPEGYTGWILFLDEFNSASMEVMAAGYKLVLDRMVGQAKLHKNVAIGCAGNLESSNAITNPMSTAMQSRLVHLVLETNTEQWLNWAMGNNIDHRITDFIKFRPNLLNTFNPEHTEYTYACNRTWEFTNRVMQHSENPAIFRAMLSGILSEGVALEFVSYCQVYHSLPDLSKIATSPETVEVPVEPSILFAITGSIANKMNLENAEQYMKYVNRLPAEFRVVTLREAVRRTPKLLSNKAIQQWALNTGQEFFKE